MRENVRSLLERALHDAGLAAPIRRQLPRQIWDAVVGRELASRAQPTVLACGVLHVLVQDHRWRNQLDAMRTELKSRLNKKLGQALVREIRFGLAHAGALPSRERAPGSREGAAALRGMELGLGEARSRRLRCPRICSAPSSWGPGCATRSCARARRRSARRAGPGRELAPQAPSPDGPARRLQCEGWPGAGREARAALATAASSRPLLARPGRRSAPMRARGSPCTRSAARWGSTCPVTSSPPSASTRAPSSSSATSPSANRRACSISAAATARSGSRSQRGFPAAARSWSIGNCSPSPPRRTTRARSGSATSWCSRRSATATSPRARASTGCSATCRRGSAARPSATSSRRAAPGSPQAASFASS